ncbi:RrF2 family transcriptional regulator [Robiginitalea marina]|uniref:Rrf2 family transcriptional regulator n=1 Tax=Robiginitalea marina TaxID=2954105 RepID=A0ABT1AZB4_9FLAO|nr:Rrf2 family transcriptional regulator [Robiginitalea marina]
MISKTAKYAIKAVIYLGLHSSESHKILTRDLYEKIQVSESYLAKILQELSRHNIISSAKGRNGGFYLTRDNGDHTLMDIVRVLDGGQYVDSCVLGISQCNAEHPCALHDKVGKGKTEFNRVLEETRVSELIADLQEGDAYFPL